MLSSVLSWYDRHIGIDSVAAHCDIPCKIYDPISAQLAAVSVIRLMDLIAELDAKDALSLADQAQLSRLVQQKEDHAEKAKHEVRVIWGDYFKQPQFDKYPDTNELVHNIMLAGSACKQHIQRANGEKLLALINDFAAAFWATKDVATYRATCPYPPSETLVYPQLN